MMVRCGPHVLPDLAALDYLCRAVTPADRPIRFNARFVVARAEAAVVAGCDVVLTCNDFAAADDLLSRWTPPPQPELARRWARMAGK